MRNHTYLLDNLQRFHYDTIIIGPEGKFNWVLQLINIQKMKLFDSHEVEFDTQLTQQIPKANEKGFHVKLCTSNRSGQPEITLDVIEARNLSDNTRVDQTRDGSGQPGECNS